MEETQYFNSNSFNRNYEQNTKKSTLNSLAAYPKDLNFSSNEKNMNSNITDISSKLINKQISFSDNNKANFTNNYFNKEYSDGSKLKSHKEKTENFDFEDDFIRIEKLFDEKVRLHENQLKDSLNFPDESVKNANFIELDNNTGNNTGNSNSNINIVNSNIVGNDNNDFPLQINSRNYKDKEVINLNLHNNIHNSNHNSNHNRVVNKNRSNSNNFPLKLSSDNNNTNNNNNIIKQNNINTGKENNIELTNSQSMNFHNNSNNNSNNNNSNKLKESKEKAFLDKIKSNSENKGNFSSQLYKILNNQIITKKINTTFSEANNNAKTNNVVKTYNSFNNTNTNNVNLDKDNIVSTNTNTNNSNNINNNNSNTNKLIDEKSKKTRNLSNFQLSMTQLITENNYDNENNNNNTNSNNNTNNNFNVNINIHRSNNNNNDNDNDVLVKSQNIPIELQRAFSPVSSETNNQTLCIETNNNNINNTNNTNNASSNNKDYPNYPNYYNKHDKNDKYFDTFMITNTNNNTNNNNKTNSIINNNNINNLNNINSNISNIREVLVDPNLSPINPKPFDNNNNLIDNFPVFFTSNKSKILELNTNTNNNYANTNTSSNNNNNNNNNSNINTANSNNKAEKNKFHLHDISGCFSPTDKDILFNNQNVILTTKNLTEVSFNGDEKVRAFESKLDTIIDSCKLELCLEEKISNHNARKVYQIKTLFKEYLELIPYEFSYSSKKLFDTLVVNLDHLLIYYNLNIKQLEESKERVVYLENALVSKSSKIEDLTRMVINLNKNADGNNGINGNCFSYGNTKEGSSNTNNINDKNDKCSIKSGVNSNFNYNYNLANLDNAKEVNKQTITVVSELMDYKINKINKTSKNESLNNKSNKQNSNTNNNTNTNNNNTNNNNNSKDNKDKSLRDYNLPFNISNHASNQRNVDLFNRKRPKSISHLKQLNTIGGLEVGSVNLNTTTVNYTNNKVKVNNTSNTRSASNDDDKNSSCGKNIYCNDSSNKECVIGYSDKVVKRNLKQLFNSLNFNFVTKTKIAVTSSTNDSSKMKVLNKKTNSTNTSNNNANNSNNNINNNSNNNNVRKFSREKLIHNTSNKRHSIEYLNSFNSNNLTSIEVENAANNNNNNNSVYAMKEGDKRILTKDKSNQKLKFDIKSLLDKNNTPEIIKSLTKTNNVKSNPCSNIIHSLNSTILGNSNLSIFTNTNNYNENTMNKNVTANNNNNNNNNTHFICSGRKKQV